MVKLKNCPIETALNYIGKKWSINIIRDLFRGKTQFKEFLGANPSLSNKVLSERLKELEENNIIEKKIVSATPLQIKYFLTKKGKSLNKILYELAVFSVKECKEEICQKNCPCTPIYEEFKKAFGVGRKE